MENDEIIKILENRMQTEVKNEIELAQRVLEIKRLLALILNSLKICNFDIKNLADLGKYLGDKDLN